MRPLGAANRGGGVSVTSSALISTALVTPLGIGTRATWAAVRGALSQIRESGFVAASGAPIRLSEVPDECLVPLPEQVAPGKSTRYRRLLRLAVTAFAQLRFPGDHPVPLFLGLPDADAAGQFPALEPFLADLSAFFPGKLDLVSSRVFASGRASGFQALEAALGLLSRSADDRTFVLVGGVDTYLDPLLLAQLERDGRLLMEQGDGFIPGEGAAFLILGPGTGRNAIQIGAPATAEEPGHMLSDEVCCGDGLTEVFGRTLNRLDQPVAAIFCGLNGENASGKEWGLAAVRLGARLAPDFTLFHPADCYGDPGAASAPALWCLAGLGLACGHLQGPLLSWCASDGATRGSALLGLANAN